MAMGDPLKEEFVKEVYIPRIVEDVSSKKFPQTTEELTEFSQELYKKILETFYSY